MKRINFQILCFLIVNGVFANKELIVNSDSLKKNSKDTSWKVSGFLGLNASQTSLSNWQGGGQNNIALNAIFNLNAVYTKNKLTWTNKLDAQYGLIKPGDVKLYRKNIDQVFALSKVNIDAFHKNWCYALQGDFRSQFAPGYNYVGDTISGKATSDFCSPAYIQLALGLDYKPAPYFSAIIAPAAGKVTIVGRQYLADAGAYGVEKAQLDAAGNVLVSGKKMRYELGGRIVIKFYKDIIKGINWDSYLDLFSSYTNNPQNIDIVFNNLLTFKINKYFSANFICQMIYDDDITIKRDWNNDGSFDHPNDINGPRLQVMSTIAIGFGYKF